MKTFESITKSSFSDLGPQDSGLGVMRLSKPLMVVPAALLALASVGSVRAYRVANWAVQAVQRVSFFCILLTLTF